MAILSPLTIEICAAISRTRIMPRANTEDRHSRQDRSRFVWITFMSAQAFTSLIVTCERTRSHASRRIIGL